MIVTPNIEQKQLKNEENDLFSRISLDLQARADNWDNGTWEGVQRNFALNVMRENIFNDTRSALIKSKIQELESKWPFINIVEELDKMFIYLIKTISSSDIETNLKWKNGISDMDDNWFDYIENQIDSKWSNKSLTSKMHNLVEIFAIDYLSNFNISPTDLTELSSWLANENILNVKYRNSFLMNAYVKQIIEETSSFSSLVPEFVDEQNFDLLLNQSAIAKSMFDLLELQINDELALKIVKEIEDNIIKSEPQSYQQAKAIYENSQSINYEEFLPGISTLLENYNLDTSALEVVVNQLDSEDAYEIKGLFDLSVDLKIPLSADNLFSASSKTIYQITDAIVYTVGDFLDKIRNILNEMNLNLAKLTIDEKDLIGLNKPFKNYTELAAWLASGEYKILAKKNSALATLDYFYELTNLNINWNFIKQLQEALDINIYPLIRFEAYINNNHDISYRLKIFENNDASGEIIVVPMGNSQHLTTSLDTIKDFVDNNLDYKNILSYHSFDNATDNALVPSWVTYNYTNWNWVKDELKQLNINLFDDRFQFSFYFCEDSLEGKKNIRLDIKDTFLNNQIASFNFSNNKIVDYDDIFKDLFDQLDQYHVLENSPVANTTKDKVSYRDFLNSLVDDEGHFFTSDFMDDSWTFEIKKEGGKNINLIISKQIGISDFSINEYESIDYEFYEKTIVIKKKLNFEEVEDAVNKMEDTVNRLTELLPEDDPRKLLMGAIMAAAVATIWDLYNSGDLTQAQLDNLIQETTNQINDLLNPNNLPIEEKVLTDIIKEYGDTITPEILYWLYDNADLINSWINSGASIEDIVKILKNDSVLDFISENKLIWKEVIDKFIKIEQNYHYGFFGVGVGLGIVGLGAGAGAAASLAINNKNKKIQKITPKANLKITFSRKIAITMTTLSLLAIASSILLLVWFFVEKGGF